MRITEGYHQYDLDPTLAYAAIDEARASGRTVRIPYDAAAYKVLRYLCDDLDTVVNGTEFWRGSDDGMVWVVIMDNGPDDDIDDDDRWQCVCFRCRCA